MCYATKRKIADCVKHLMRKKEIRKITIQDIMDETHMSRQSFYYHFKDIYDVLEWIMRYDFAKHITCEEDQTMEAWTLHLFHVLDEERPFFERVVNEIEWPKLLPVVSGPIEEQIRLILSRYIRVGSMEELNFCVRFATTAYCYYLMDYIYHRKRKTDQELSYEVHSLLAMIDTQPPAIHTLDIRSSESRLVG